MLHVLLLATTVALPSPAPKRQPFYGCYANTNCNRKPYVCFAGLGWAPCGPFHRAEYVVVHVDAPDSVKIDGRKYLLTDLDEYFKGLASTKPAAQVRIIADPGAQHAAITHVMNAAASAGLSISRVLPSPPPAH